MEITMDVVRHSHGVPPEHLERLAQLEVTSHYEAGDLTTSHAVEIFRAWKKCLPGYAWSYAAVDRLEGLVLIEPDFDHSTAITLHFKSALCGYGGNGPGASVDILHEAGFGSHEMLSEVVTRHMKCMFAKEM